MDKCDLKFTPPVCVQRYIAMKNMVKKLQPQKVLDMGCGECSLLRQLKQEQCLEQLTGVDIDADILQSHKYLAKPLMCEYLHPRSHPFTVSLYEGSISKKDHRMLGYDLALCVEIVEHLYPDTLAALPEVLFGYMRPRTVVFTTPNADFNVLFPDFQGFRHPDHKFEWSREEFQSWGNKVASDYGYTVTYEGIGAGPPGTEHLGCCTQMAVFTCMASPQEGSRQLDCSSPQTPYNLVCEVKYPHRVITTTTEEQILNEAMFYLKRFWHTAGQSYSEREEDGEDHVTRTGDAGTTEDIEGAEEQENGTDHVTRSGDAGTTQKVEEQEDSTDHVTRSGDAGTTQKVEEQEDSTDHVTRSGDAGTTEEVEEAEEQDSTDHVTRSGDAGTIQKVEEQDSTDHVTRSGDSGRTQEVEEAEEQDSINHVIRSGDVGTAEEVEEAEEQDSTDHVTRSGDTRRTEKVEEAEEQDSTDHVTRSGDSGATEEVEEAEAQDSINHVTRSGDAGTAEEQEELERRTLSVSLETLMKLSALRRVCPSMEKLREVLASCDSFSISDDGKSVLYSMEESSSDSDNQSDDSNTSEDEGQDNERLDSNKNDALSWQQEEESWDW
ncbi:dentin sialophosphoprotein-like [Patiria miniata]|uniref:Small RNA 2'-O-methyltransferase n=1 Tax=Patiria miniata TaxID=46514 RepID=A0A914BBD0_PATMI|nr:dentin sialophosphoprotein-like [Patiria miniata]